MQVGTTGWRARTFVAGLLTAMAVSMVVAASASATAHVTGVTWTGSSSSPTVTITGYGFGTSPPTSHPLPSTCGRQTGKDYGLGLWFQDDTGSWRAGRGNGKASSNCVGLLISRWRKTAITLSFGSAYGNSGWVANSNDNFVWTVKGYVWGGVIGYP